eukprot:scaffold79624_cov25-Prasinocladus_malaysianus.AAC.1
MVLVLQIAAVTARTQHPELDATGVHYMPFVKIETFPQAFPANLDTIGDQLSQINCLCLPDVILLPLFIDDAKSSCHIGCRVEHFSGQWDLTGLWSFSTYIPEVS